MFVFGLAEAAAVGVLGFAGTLPMFCLSAALAGIGAGGRIPLTLAVHGVYFGRRNFATITWRFRYSGFARSASESGQLRDGLLFAVFTVSSRLCGLPEAG